MKMRRIFGVALFAGVLGMTEAASAQTTVTLGSQDFADGTTPTTATFLTAGAGEPAPFNGVFVGSDVTGPNFSASWTFTYAPLATVTAGRMTLGIYDHESSASGNQVASFTLNGIELAAPLNALFEARGGGSRVDNVYTLALPGSTFAALQTGAVTFALSLQGPGLGVLGETTFNGAALDFSTLAVTSVPEPETYAMLLAGLAMLGLILKRRAS
ncbi:MAG: PEP-CTERM sorting domain-containing protein [Candidatus Methylophosphatis roskildensis]